MINRDFFYETQMQLKSLNELRSNRRFQGIDPLQGYVITRAIFDTLSNFSFVYQKALNSYINYVKIGTPQAIYKRSSVYDFIDGNCFIFHKDAIAILKESDYFVIKKIDNPDEVFSGILKLSDIPRDHPYHMLNSKKFEYVELAMVACYLTSYELWTEEVTL